MSDATARLFSAIDAYGMHEGYRDPGRESAALDGMRGALADGADWTAKIGPGGRDAGLSAAACASRDPLELLLAHGVPLDHRTAAETLLHRAAAFSSTDVVRMLVGRGLAPDWADPLGRTPLQCARAWKHGVRSVPVLIELLKAHGCAPGPARRGDDLLPGELGEVSPRLGGVLAAAFVERAGTSSKDLLRAVVELEDNALTAEALEVVARASHARAKPKTIPGRKRVDLVHHGDLVVRGDCDAATLVVTGDLLVEGLLTNHEGCRVAVGGDLNAGSVWSEGPLVVGGDATARTAFACAYNDHGALIRGVLRSPVLVRIDHALEAGAVEVDRTITERQSIPEALLAPLGLRKGPRQ